MKKISAPLFPNRLSNHYYHSPGTNRVSVPKKELYRFHVQSPQISPKRLGRKLVTRLGRGTKTSTQQSGENTEGRGEDSRVPTSTALVPLQNLPPKKDAWQWWQLWLGILSLMGITVASGALFLTQLPPPINCQRISPLSGDGERLYCAQASAESGKLENVVAAVRLVQNWSPDNPLYREAQRKLKEWSEVILQIAQQKINQGSQPEAVTIASYIPASSPLYPEAQAAIATWQQEWKQGEETVSKFQDALKVQKWQQASLLIAALSKSKREYWRMTRVDGMMKQLSTEKEAWEQLQEARDLAKTNLLEEIKKAITLTTKINPNSYVKAQALEEQSRWSRTLLEIAAKSFYKGDFVAVMNMLDSIPVNSPQYLEAQDWIRLAHGAKTAKKDNILALVDALAAARQISARSPVRKLASKQAATWQSQLQDQVKLNYAAFVASFQQRTGFQIAINQAQKVAPGRPQRVFAQTLIAQWRKEIQQIEDRNNLAEAQQLAEWGTLEPLKTAVEMASQINLGQPLRPVAQGAIAKWNRQIQTLEDRPILELADTFAQRKEWMAAISTAEQIRPERALYSQAQQAIAQWVAQVQILQDTPILDAATALAAQGRFDAAIATATQISSERALYQQAQSAIATWTSQQKAATSNETPQSN